MDLFFLHKGQRFVWDEEKSAKNLVKHGVGFERACEVFFDPFVRVVDAGVADERRDAAIGLTEDWSLLFVVHLWWEGDVIRVVSARPADAGERRVYEDGE